MGQWRKAAGAVVVAMALAVAGCGSDDDESTSASTAGGATQATSDVAQKAQESLAKLSTEVLSKGPNGESPAPAADVELTPEEIEKVKGMGATAAIVMHYGGNDWSTAQVEGLKQQFADLGIEVIATTDANFKPEKQVSDIETVLARKPDIIVSIPTDPVATADAYRKAAAAGVKLVFMDNVPQDFVAGEDYVSVVSADNYGNGVAAAHLLAKAIECEGEVGALHYADASNYATEQRWQAFQDTLAENYPDMEIVEDQGINAPDWAGDSEKAASAMLTKHPDLKGIFAWFDIPAEGAKQAVSANGTSQPITTVDLGLNVAIDIASGGLIKGLGAQLPYDQGVAEATLAGYALLGKEAPPYVVLPPLPVSQDNVLEAWEQVYHSAPPEELTAAANG